MEMTEKKSSDFEAFKRQVASRIKKGDTLLGKDGVFAPLLKQFLEEAMNGELKLKTRRICFYSVGFAEVFFWTN